MGKTSFSRAGSPLIPFTIASVIIGAIRGHLSQPSGHVGSGYLRGGATGAAICIAILILETTLLEGRGRFSVRRWPFPLQVAVRTITYLVIILAGLSVVPVFFSDTATMLLPRAGDVWLVSAICVAFNALVGINQLLGQGVLFSFIVGRYHTPRSEERIVLFLDMESSTHHAEMLGEVRFVGLLNRFVADVSSAIVARGGEIHKYVGDEIIATWKPEDSPSNARCIAACFDAAETLTSLNSKYEREFGTAVRFRAGLHAGKVVIGELGLFKMEIALLGDVMNTTARIQAMCRETGHRVLASAAIVNRITPFPPDVAVKSLGEIRLRGKEQDIEVFMLSRDIMTK